ncbi:keratin, type I cytoskeletal 9-like [Planococcus citri]|uniref:keratin, type I cytoskeletal 9-like n=1 Tax=Planococcus citri TaxID=170843 RepID=UPI0031F9A184
MISKFSIVFALVILSLGSIQVDCNGDKGGGGGDGGDGGKCGNKLKVTISFDSMDCNSINYMKEQVKPAVDELSGCVEWDFIPCSTSKIVQDVLQCKDGIDECNIDALHACASHFFQDSQSNELAKFFTCMMTNGDQKTSGQKCAQQAGLDWNKIKGCKPCNDAGKYCDNRYKLLDMLHEPNIPGVMFNRKFDCKKEQDAMKDLKGTICDELKQTGGQCPACNGCGGKGGGGGGGGPGGSGGGGSPGGHGGSGSGGSGGGGGNSPSKGDGGGNSPSKGSEGGGGNPPSKNDGGGGGQNPSMGVNPNPPDNSLPSAPPGTPNFTNYDNGNKFSYNGLILPNNDNKLMRK